MVEVREEIEHDIWWQVKSGNSSFWYDNWAKQGALYFIEGELAREEEIEVKEFQSGGDWNINKLLECVSPEMTAHIVENIKPGKESGMIDKAWWMGNSKGVFTAKSTYHSMRRSMNELEWMNQLWLKGLPFKIAFFLWRVWKKRIATDDNLKRMRMQIASKCYCCENGEMETMTHLFLTTPITQKLWRRFASCAGLNIEVLQLQQLIMKWWELKTNQKLHSVLIAVPAIIMWELWKRRNARRHGKETSLNKMYYQCQLNVYYLIKVKFPWLRNIPHTWQGMFHQLLEYRPILHYLAVKWTRLHERCVKCNTDGASKGNLGESAYGFCIRDSSGDLLYA
ncbi:hypothetical protein RDI58_022386 [Solanum bulbocastanum]|uniref:Reverse transcriptase zinc-binding domain-containing protein n=1 Tax=Solanum bulbocastanum TaxID=147425 RepID=A0AAN8T7E9_SOLBU